VVLSWAYLARKMMDRLISEIDEGDIVMIGG
jgi:hypothetical protein